MKDFDYRYGRRVTIIGIAGNIAVAAFKYICGIAGNSGALIADAVHSVSDIIATVAVLFGIKFGSKPMDKKHPYGHGKIESLISLFIGILLIVTALYLLYENSIKLYRSEVLVPSRIAVIGVIISIVFKEWMFRYTISAGKKINSPAITANAWDHRSDVYSSIGVLTGISLAKLNMPYFDSIAAIIVSFFIVGMGYKISRDSINDLIDSQVPISLMNEINNVISECENRYEVKEIKGRRMGASYIVDLKLRFPPYISAKDGTKNINELKRLLLLKIKTLQDVIITIETDYKISDLFETKFKNEVKDILSRYSGEYIETHKLYYHFQIGRAHV